MKSKIGISRWHSLGDGFDGMIHKATAKILADKYFKLAPLNCYLFTDMPKVFISYSHKDEDWKVRLQTQLAVLENQGLLSVWEDRKIAGGVTCREPDIFLLQAGFYHL